MGLSCGLVGLASCGKTVIFNAVTATRVSSYSGSEMNRLVINVPDRRLERLAQMYHPSKVVPTTLEIVDIPGLTVRPQTDGHGFRLLGHVKNVEALLHVIRCFEDGNVPFEYETIDPVRDVDTVDLELMAADSATLENKINRLAKKLRAGDKDAIREAADYEKVRSGIQQGIPARKHNLDARELASVRDCNLVSLKPVLYVGNIKSTQDAANKHVTALRRIADAEHTEMIVVCGRDEADISQLEPDEREDFLRELGMGESSMERLVHAAYRMLGLVTFFTTGEDEVRAWTLGVGATASQAAGVIHTDLERGFVRAEVLGYSDWEKYRSFAVARDAGTVRLEGKDYVVVDGDLINIRSGLAKSRG